MYLKIFKRGFDVMISFFILVFFFPIFAIVTITLFFANNGSPFFLQKRPGRNAELFRVIKFKTMSDKKDKNGDLLPDAERLSKIGSFIRKTSIDEIPQLLNVLKGEMSLIGPRPLLPEYLSLYNEEQRMRHLVKPGITGWAQVNGRNAISWAKKFELDVWYVNNQSFLIDMKIFLMTIKKVFISEGINQAGEATTAAFNGKN
jgi:undecaprenyl phosphate N,N'-diacetylbacillosamine 1-phosphate transferase